MLEPAVAGKKFIESLRRQPKIAFGAAFITGLFVHMPIMLRDIPNHDGLSSMYFDQDMITSGRWFLTIACGISSYFTLPWVIGLLAMLFLSLAAMVTVDYLKVQSSVAAAFIGGIFVIFPSIASMYAYVFTMDGYMMGILLAVLAPWCVEKGKYGWLVGAVCLSLSLGIYQAFLPMTIMLSLYGVSILLLQTDHRTGIMKGILSYAGMGLGGGALYYGILRLLLAVRGLELASYQGINSATGESQVGIMQRILHMYTDFFSFSLKGRILFHDLFSVIGIVILLILTGFAVLKGIQRKKAYKNPWLYCIIVLLAVLIPLGMNIILFLSPSVNYHSLMRYQWVMIPVLCLALVDKEFKNRAWLQWMTLVAAFVLCLDYAVTDNIAYSNLEKRYEKTYAYCVRLLDRMEQTEGYYVGIPVAIIGVVGDEYYPVTDITQDVTATMIGISGDTLLYTGSNYQAFFKNYLGVELNVLDADQMEEIYLSEEYRALESFPGKDSMRVIDGVLYIKTENNHYD